MPTRVDLPKDIVTVALQQAAQLRARGIKAATNALIKQALSEEEDAIRKALQTISDTK